MEIESPEAAVLPRLHNFLQVLIVSPPPNAFVSTSNHRGDRSLPSGFGLPGDVLSGF